jgi:hypothetical protein
MKSVFGEYLEKGSWRIFHPTFKSIDMKTQNQFKE